MCRRLGKGQEEMLSFIVCTGSLTWKAWKLIPRSCHVVSLYMLMLRIQFRVMVKVQLLITHSSIEFMRSCANELFRYCGDIFRAQGRDTGIQTATGYGCEIALYLQIKLLVLWWHFMWRCYLQHASSASVLSAVAKEKKQAVAQRCMRQVIYVAILEFSGSFWLATWISLFNNIWSLYKRICV